MNSSAKKAQITSVTGQDGSHLTELLLDKGYDCHGIKRRASQFNTRRVDHICENPHCDHQGLMPRYGDLNDSSNFTRTLQQAGARRGVQPRCAEPCHGELLGARVHG